MRLKVAVVALLAVVVVLVSVPSSAQMVTGLHIIPVAIHSPGVAPSFWKTDVFVTNWGENSLKVGFLFFPEGQTNAMTFTIPEKQIQVVGAKQSLLVEDIVATMFGQSNKKGMLMVISDAMWIPTNDPDSEKIMVSARTYNTGSDPRGTFGQTATNMLLYLNTGPRSAWIAGARFDSKFRANLGIGSLSPATIRVHYRVRRPNGTVAAEGSKDIPAFSMGQWSLSSLGVAQQEGPLAIELFLDEESVTGGFCTGGFVSANAFYAYASPVDGAASGAGTGDGEMLYAIPENDLQVLDCIQ